MKYIRLFILSIVLAFSVSGYADKINIAIFDPTSNGTAIDEGTKMAIRELISSTIVNLGEYDIVERSLLEKVMQEQQFTNSGVVDDSQAMEIGKLAGASKVILSVVTLTGGRNMLSIKMIDVQTAKIDRQKVKVVSSGELLDAIEPLTLSLMDKDAPAESVQPNRPTQPSRPTNNYTATANNVYAGGDFVPSPERILRSQGLNLGSLAELLGEESVYVVCDFSPARVDGMDLLKFGEIGSPDYKDSYPSFGASIVDAQKIMAKYFVEAANGKTKYFKYQNANPNTNYTLTIYMVKISKNGSKNTCDYVFTETSTGREVAVITMEANGGRIGNFNNLMGDAFRDNSGNFAKIVNKELEKAAKDSKGGKGNKGGKGVFGIIK